MDLNRTPLAYRITSTAPISNTNSVDEGSDGSIITFRINNTLQQ